MGLRQEATILIQLLTQTIAEFAELVGGISSGTCGRRLPVFVVKNRRTRLGEEVERFLFHIYLRCLWEGITTIFRCCQVQVMFRSELIKQTSAEYVESNGFGGQVNWSR